VLENARQTGSINYVHFIVAVRKTSGAVGIIYTIGIQQRKKNASSEDAFSQIVKSFQATTLP
jgi:hypothetical protein